MADLVNLVASSFPSDRKKYDSVVIISNNVKKIRQIYEVIPKDTEISILSSKSRVVESFDNSQISVQLLDESLSSMGLQILTQLHDMILQAIGEGRISRCEKILAELINWGNKKVQQAGALYRSFYMFVSLILARWTF